MYLNPVFQVNGCGLADEGGTLGQPRDRMIKMSQACFQAKSAKNTRKYINRQAFQGGRTRTGPSKYRALVSHATLVRTRVTQCK